MQKTISENSSKLVHQPYIDYLEAIKANEIVDVTIIDPEITSYDYNYCFRQSSFFRNACQEAGIYSIVTKKLVSNLTKLLNGKRCLEVMAGRGLLSYHLNKNGVEVIATDDNSWSLNNLDVIKMSGLDAISHYYDQVDILILCWPPMNSAAFEIIKAWGTEKPILVGGEIGGCCANELFETHFSGEYLDVGHVTFYGVYDSFQLGYFKP